jgi:hypothetical protein
MYYRTLLPRFNPPAYRYLKSIVAMGYEGACIDAQVQGDASKSALSDESFLLEKSWLLSQRVLKNSQHLQYGGTTFRRT